jgi:hypothetical protein
VGYRIQFWRLWLTATVLGQVFFAALVLGIDLVMRPVANTAGYLAANAFAAAAILPMLAGGLWIYVRVWQVWVGPATLCGSDVWGRFVTVSWRSIYVARTINVAGLPYLRVYSTETRRVIWLPLFLADYRRFAELVAEHAGEDHPVTREVWRRIEDS